MSTAGIAGIHYLPPGIEGLIATFESAVFYGDNRYWNYYKLQQSLIAGTARDLGNTPTTELRAGLLMAYDPVTNKWSEYIDADLGFQGILSGMLFASIQTQRDGADQDRFVSAISFGGLWRAEAIIHSNAANTSPGLAGATGETGTRAELLNRMNLVRLSDAHEQALP